MTACAPTLSELQRLIGQSLLHGAGSDALHSVAADGLDPGARLSIYRNTATATLVKALQLSFPAIQALVGPEFFEGAARRFIEAEPPRGAWLDAYGSTFPDFLAELPQAASLAYLPDTARLEWAVTSVLHAPDAPTLDLGSLARRQASQPGDLRFVPHPAVRLLRAAFPVDAIWRAVLDHDDAALAAIDPTTGPVWLRIQRTPLGPAAERLSEAQWRFACALFAGQALSAALEEAGSPEAHVWLATLLADGSFTAVEPESEPSRHAPDPTVWSQKP